MWNTIIWFGEIHKVLPPYPFYPIILATTAAVRLVCCALFESCKELHWKFFPHDQTADYRVIFYTLLSIKGRILICQYLQYLSPPPPTDLLFFKSIIIFLTSWFERSWTQNFLEILYFCLIISMYGRFSYLNIIITKLSWSE